MPVESQLVRTLLNSNFALTAEVTPPVSGGRNVLLDRVKPLRGLVDAVNVTDGPGARVHMSALAAAAILAASGVEPVFQLTCRDRNRIALQADLLGASSLGIHNVLMLGGDDPTVGDEPDATPVFDFDSGDLIRIAAMMRDQGKLPSGKIIDASPSFFIGAADTPVDPPDGWRAEALARKVQAGAQFVQTQFCFDIEVVRKYVGRLNDLGLTDQLFILIGIGPLASARSARWMRDNLWGTIIPDNIVKRMEGAADAEAEGVMICAELIEQLAAIPGVSGAHLMAPVKPSLIPLAIEKADIGARRG
jgi:methylenetetrahydrofolate reductase (NADPH)